MLCSGGRFKKELCSLVGSLKCEHPVTELLVRQGHLTILDPCALGPLDFQVCQSSSDALELFCSCSSIVKSLLLS